MIGENEDDDNQYLLNYSNKCSILWKGLGFLKRICVQVTKYFFIILLNYKVKKKVIGSNESKQFSCMKNNNLEHVLANYGSGAKFGSSSIFV